MRTPSISKDQIIIAMEQWIIGNKAERNRQIYADRLFRGLTYEELAEAYEMSPRQIQNVIHDCEKKVFSHIPG